MSDVSIHLFGPTPIRRDGRPVSLGISGSTLALLRYLLVNANRAHRREVICDLIWHDGSASRPRAALNSALWRLQKIIAGLPGLDLESDADHICLILPENTRCDARDLVACVQAAGDVRALDGEDARALRHALEACSEAFLDGAEHEWALIERERLFNIQVRGLALLTRWHGIHGQYEDALDHGRTLLSIDPFREAVISEMLWLYVLNGQRAQALRLFETFRAMLAAELDVAPLPETVALYQHIKDDMNGLGVSVTPTQASPRPASLNHMLSAIEKSRRDTYHVLHTSPQPAG